ncbi:MAG TPA: VOC family protein [Ideonella sp.]|uniref:VOC family protein n=1 Tax=Ideonella sp. TaxID=1929293 RepID=UPI002CDE60F4|nr:VOC family protein [Ideonella sp.]HSI49825.1 VOC family protein [Ideonella sp.]
MPRTLPPNRSIPDAAVIPVLHYPSVPEAVAWLCGCFGFTERLRIGTHRVQLNAPMGSGAVVVADRGEASGHAASVSVMLRVVDIDALFHAAFAAGARVLQSPETHVYGERQCTVADPGGHVWTLTESVEDVHPASWGGEYVEPETRQ